MAERQKKIYEKIGSDEKDDLLRTFLPFLSRGKFVNVATCNLERMPNVAPKLIAKAEKNFIFVIDYVLGTTFTNLKENPRISLSFIDDRTLTGYQLNGTATVLEKGDISDELAEEFQQIKTNFTVERILYNIRTGEKTSPIELSLPEKFAIIKIRVIEIVEISSSGSLKSKFVL